MASHKNLYLSSLNCAISTGIRPNHANQISVLPLFHITALTLALTCLHVGGKLVLLEEFHADDILQLIELEQVNTSMLLPMMWKGLLGAPSLDKHDYSSMQFGLYGMAPMDDDTLNRLNQTFGCEFFLGSGQTEISGASTIMNPKWHGKKTGNYWGDGSICCDQAVMGDNGELLGPNEVGEIVWRSPQVMVGYLNDEAVTAEARAHGWHHSGDLGYIDTDNQLIFVDRKKDIVKSGGENVSSVLVESVLLSAPGVVNAAVIGVPHAHWGEAIVAVVIRSDNSLDENSLIESAKKQLGGFQVPKKIIFTNNFPMTATGKIQKNLLRDQYQTLFDNLR